MIPKVVYVLNEAKFLISHRLEICLEAKKKGFDVHVICPDSDFTSKLIEYGFNVHFVEFGRNRTNPFMELKSLFKILYFFYKIKPDLVHLITIKPYLYGGIAARIIGIKAVVSAVAGLGILFSSNNFKYRALRFLLYPFFKVAFGHKKQNVIFQNASDRDVFLGWGLVENNRIRMIRGSGVDLGTCVIDDEPNGIPIISFAARLLKDKGVEVFVEASYLLRQRGIEARFWLIGEPDPGNTNSVSQKQLDIWKKDDIVEFFGFRKDVPYLFSQSNIVALPSFYGEGLPKVLTEAAACGRPVITTDHPGCRDAIDPGQTGMLIPTRDSFALADAIQELIENPAKRKSMGLKGRILAEQEFDVRGVVKKHMDIYKKLLEN